MRIEVRFFAALRERAGRERLTLEGLEPGLDVAGLKRELAERHPEVGDLSSVSGVVATTYVRDDHALADGDEVALLPPVSGGSPDDDSDDLESGVFELSADPLDPGALQARLVHPACGAIVLFTGTTRERNRGQDVALLDYEAFHEMAGPEMARIFDDCRAQVAPDPEHPLRMLCVHRTGTVGVGEASVVVGAASPHRATAFEAARFLIDTLKERLPVWKKEVYGDGHHWIGDRS